MNKLRRWRQLALFYTLLVAYAGMQGYSVHVAYDGLALPPASVPWLIVWVLMMTCFPFLLWWLEHRGWHRVAAAGAWLGYTWMGLVFLFFWIALALAALGHLVQAAPALQIAGLVASHTQSFLLAIAITLAVAAYGYLAAARPRIERVRLVSAKLPAASAPLRLALISDVHLGPLVGRRRLQRILALLETLKPDLVVSTGDLVDGQADHINQLVPMLAALRPPLGKYAVIGNHECFVGLEHALDFHARSGFAVLRGTAVNVTDTLTLAGVDDPAAARFAGAQLDEAPALTGIGVHRYVVLLKHQPVAADNGRFDLQLSGHVHQGQIFPFGFLVRLVYPVAAGLTHLAHGGNLYVSRGTGTWGPPLRVLAPAEITLIELAPAH